MYFFLFVCITAAWLLFDVMCCDFAENFILLLFQLFIILKLAGHFEQYGIDAEWHMEKEYVMG